MVNGIKTQTSTLEGHGPDSTDEGVEPHGDDVLDLASADRQTIDIPTAARLLGCSRGLAYQMARDGRLPVIQLSARRVVVPLPALRRMLQGEPLANDENEVHE